MEAFLITCIAFFVLWLIVVAVHESKAAALNPAPYRSYRARRRTRSGSVAWAIQSVGHGHSWDHDISHVGTTPFERSADVHVSLAVEDGGDDHVDVDVSDAADGTCIGDAHAFDWSSDDGSSFDVCSDDSSGFDVDFSSDD